MSRKAVIMGATSGIGLEVAKALAEQGWQVGIAGRRESLLNDIQNSVPNIAATQCIDVTAPDAGQRLDRLIEQLGGMDLYLHSSGIGYQNPVLDAEKELATVETNAVGFTRMADRAFKYFEAHPDREGHLAAISSIACTRPLGAAPSYSASKRFVSHYLECLAQLSAIRGMRKFHTHDIRPGFVRTAILNGSNAYPMQLDASRTARLIVRGIKKGRSVIIVDWKYRLLVAFWHLIPRPIWVRLRVSSKK